MIRSLPLALAVGAALAAFALFTTAASAAPAGADLRVDVATAPYTTPTGGTATIRVRVRNIGDADAANVRLDLFASNFAVNSVSAPAGWACDATGCNAPVLAAGKSVTISFFVTRTDTGSYTHPSASVSTSTPESNYANNSALSRPTLA